MTQCLCSFILSLQDSGRLGKGWNIYCSAGAQDSADTSVSELLAPHSLLQKRGDVGPGDGSWKAVKGLALSSSLTHPCKSGAGQPEQPKALDNPDLVSSGSEGVAGQAELGMNSGKMCRSRVQFLQVSLWVWGTARTPQGIINAVRYLWLLGKGVHKDLLPGTWPSVSFFN